MTRSARHSARVTPALAPVAQLKAGVARWKDSITAEKRQRLQASFLCFTLPAWTPSRGAEIDILEFTGRTINAYEVKSGQTVSAEFTKQLGEAVANLRGACKSQQELRQSWCMAGIRPAADMMSTFCRGRMSEKTAARYPANPYPPRSRIQRRFFLEPRRRRI